jgi:A/G-specific adenine glycosylase
MTDFKGYKVADIAGYFFDSSSLLEWFEKNKRSFPWRDSPDPYRVWVSEVMLQQTRASVVIPYFQKWMTLFEDVKALAKAEVADVIKAWEGLGYYSRARNLHLGAKQIVNDFGGVFPSREEDLQKIKGLGPYTIGAILSFAFGKKVPCVDGNVTRVLSRYYGVEEDILKSSTQKKIWSFARGIVERSETGRIAEALIELGALVCQKKAYCEVCPLQGRCLAFKLDRQNELPIKSKKPPCTKLSRIAFLIEHEGKFLVKKAKEGEIMQDLYEFPYREVEGEPSKGEVCSIANELFGEKLELKKSYSAVRHTFTRFRVELHPFHFVAKRALTCKGHEWITFENLGKIAFSSGHRRILNMVSL